MVPARLRCRNLRKSALTSARKDRSTSSRRASVSLAGVGIDEGLAEKALDSVKEKLDTKYGIMLLQPAYSTLLPEPR